MKELRWLAVRKCRGVRSFFVRLKLVDNFFAKNAHHLNQNYHIETKHGVKVFVLIYPTHFFCCQHSRRGTFDVFHDVSERPDTIRTKLGDCRLRGKRQRSTNNDNGDSSLCLLSWTLDEPVELVSESERDSAQVKNFQQHCSMIHWTIQNWEAIHEMGRSSWEITRALHRAFLLQNARSSEENTLCYFQFLILHYSAQLCIEKKTFTSFHIFWAKSFGTFLSLHFIWETTNMNISQKSAQEMFISVFKEKVYFDSR